MPYHEVPSVHNLRSSGEGCHNSLYMPEEERADGLVKTAHRRYTRGLRQYGGTPGIPGDAGYTLCKSETVSGLDSDELQGPRNILGLRQEICHFGPDLGLKLGKTNPQISGTVPTNRHTTIPNDPGPISACFDDDPTLLNCEIA